MDQDNDICGKIMSRCYSPCLYLGLLWIEENLKILEEKKEALQVEMPNDIVLENRIRCHYD
jgi:hypothetical protein